MKLQKASDKNLTWYTHWPYMLRLRACGSEWRINWKLAERWFVPQQFETIIQFCVFHIPIFTSQIAHSIANDYYYSYFITKLFYYHYIRIYLQSRSSRSSQSRFLCNFLTQIDKIVCCVSVSRKPMSDFIPPHSIIYVYQCAYRQPGDCETGT